MPRQALTDGRWFDVANEQQFQNLKRCGRLTYEQFWTARVQIGTYEGPGRYLLLSYQQKCPRGCCYDSVYEVLSADDVIKESKEQMREYADLLKQAKGVQ